MRVAFVAFVALCALAACRASSGDVSAQSAAGAGSVATRLLYRFGAGEVRGAEFVPPRAAAGAPLPLLLLFDPNGNAEGAVRRWSKAAAERGWFLASSTAIRNGTPDSDDEAHMLALLAHMEAHHAIDPERVAVSGFSGGGCGAYRLALSRPERFRGAIAECAHMGSWRDFKGKRPAGHPFYLFTRTSDFNQPATRQLYAAMLSHGLEVRYTEKPGAHQPMASEETTEALAWLESALAATAR